jgi:hypothetical protein
MFCFYIYLCFLFNLRLNHDSNVLTSESNICVTQIYFRHEKHVQNQKKRKYKITQNKIKLIKMSIFNLFYLFVIIFLLKMLVRSILFNLLLKTKSKIGGFFVFV